MNTIKSVERGGRIQAIFKVSAIQAIRFFHKADEVMSFSLPNITLDFPLEYEKTSGYGGYGYFEFDGKKYPKNREDARLLADDVFKLME